MTSAGSPPSNEVSSWSCTDPQSPWTYSTWTSGFCAFHCRTSALFAAMDCSCQARLWKRRWTGPSELASPPPPPQAATRVSAAAAAAPFRTARCMVVLLSLGRAGHQTAGQPALDECEEDETGQGGDEGARRERPEPSDALEPDEAGERERKRLQLWALDQHQGEEELVP